MIKPKFTNASNVDELLNKMTSKYKKWNISETTDWIILECGPVQSSLSHLFTQIVTSKKSIYNADNISTSCLSFPVLTQSYEYILCLNLNILSNMTNEVKIMSLG